MIQPTQRHVYASRTPARASSARNPVCGRCGKARGGHEGRDRRIPPVCQSCREVLRHDGWTTERIDAFYGKG